MFCDETTPKNTGGLNRHNCHYCWIRILINIDKEIINIVAALLCEVVFIGDNLIEPYLSMEMFLQNQLEGLLEEAGFDTRTEDVISFRWGWSTLP